jgi:tetratricopeptide (TPR) repeat protein
MKKAMRVCPLYRPGFLRSLGLAYRLSGNLEAAVSAYKESLRRDSEYLSGHVNLTSTLGELGREEEAKKAAREIYRLEPKFSIKAYMEGLSYRNPSDLARIEEGLKKAGLPD